jgi:hypothetical protein
MNDRCTTEGMWSFIRCVESNAAEVIHCFVSSLLHLRE